MKNINFQWHIERNSSLYRDLEEQIKGDIEKGKIGPFCQSGDLLIVGKYANPFNTIIEGTINCSCGDSCTTFIARDDSRELVYKKIIHI